MVMEITETPIEGLMVVKTNPHLEQRGKFTRLYCQEELKGIIASRQIAQINLSCSFAVGTLRGFHYQHPPHAEMKLIRCLKGKVWDVALDLRVDSPTFLSWHVEELTPENAHMFVIPEGCAHGFQVLEPNTEMLYLHTAFYVPEAEGGVAYNDPELAVPWPLPPIGISARDQKNPTVSSIFEGIRK